MRVIHSVLQVEDSDCGVACLEFLMGKGRLEFDTELLRERLESLDGDVPLSRFKTIASECGIEMEIRSFERNEHMRFAGFPVVVPILNDEGNRHLVVACGFVAGRWLVMDPARGWRIISARKMQTIWLGLALCIQHDKTISDHIPSSAPFGTKRRHAKNKIRTAFNMQYYAIIFFLSVFALLVSIVNTHMYSYAALMLSSGSNNGWKLTLLVFFVVVTLMHSIIGVLLAVSKQLLSMNARTVLSDILIESLGNGADYSSLEKRKTGQLVARVDDVDEYISYWVTRNLSLPVKITEITFLLVYLWFSGPTVFFTALASLIIVICLILGFYRPLYKRGTRLRIAETTWLQNLTNRFESISEIKRNRGIDWFRYSHLRDVISLNRATLSVEYFISIVQSVMGFALGTIGTIIIIYSVEDIAAFGQAVTAFMLVTLLYEPAAEVASFFEVRARTAFARARFYDSLIYFGRLPESLKLTFCNNADELVSLDHVQVKYGDKYVPSSSVVISVQSGTTLAISGASGSGKSTLLKTLAGELNPDTGCIRLPRGKRVTYVPQEPVLFYGSLVENIAFKLPDDMTTSETECLNQMLEKLGFDDIDILRLTNPLFTISSASRNLSGGQKMRIALARALWQKPDILLLDEFSAPLSIEDTRSVCSYIDSLHIPYVIVATHDPFVEQWASERLLLSVCGE